LRPVPDHITHTKPAPLICTMNSCSLKHHSHSSRASSRAAQRAGGSGSCRLPHQSINWRARPPPCRRLSHRPTASASHQPAPTAAACDSAHHDPQQQRWRVRRATRADADVVGRVCGEAFGSGALPGVEDSAAIQRLEERYAAAITKEVAEKLRSALDVKDKVGSPWPCGSVAQRRPTPQTLPRAASLHPLHPTGAINYPRPPHCNTAKPLTGHA